MLDYSEQFDHRFITRAKKFSIVVSVFVMLVGALVLIGWVFDIYRLKTTYGDITMKANAALALVLAGASLWLLNSSPDNRSRRLAGQALAALVTLIGGVTLIEHIFGRSFGVDQLLFTEPAGALATVSPGRMGLPASSCLTLSGIALLLLYARRAVSLAQVFSVIVGLWALLAVIGYAYQAEELYGISRSTGIALHTAVSFFVLSLGLLAARIDRGVTAVISSEHSGSLMARRLLVSAITIPFILGWLRLTAQRAGYFDLGFGVALFVVSIIVIFASIVWRAARKLNHTEQQRLATEAFGRKKDEHLRRLAALIELSYEPIFIWELDAGIVEWNKGCEQLYRYSRERAVGQMSHQLLQTEFSTALDDYMETLMRDGRWSGELRHKNADGIDVLVESRQQLIESREGHRLVLETDRDITERKRAEQTSAHLAAIVTSSSDAILSKTLDGVITSWNKGATRMFLYTAEEMIGQSILRLIPTDRCEEEEGILARLKANERIEPYETVRVTKDGRDLDVSLTISPIKDSKGKIVGASKIIHDITERKRAEEALRESQQQYAALVTNLPDIVFRLDENLRHLYISPVVEKYAGVPPESFIGKTGREIGLPRSACDEFEALARHTLATGEERQMEFEAGGRVFRSRLIRRMDNGAGLSLLGLTEDITERRQAEEERKRLLESEQAARVAAENASRLKDEFLATISHELRTPLSAVLGWATVLRGKKLDEDTAVQALESIERNARSQAQLIEDLLDVSRITSGQLRLDVQPIELISVIKAAVDSLGLAAEAKGIELELVLDPAADNIQGDASRLQQVVWNLLSNAVKFTPKGGQVQVKLDRVDSVARVAVSDTGEGISQEFLPYVFDRFQQADGTVTRRHGGLGLGLAIARHLVEMHGGTLEASSEGLGRGAVFTVKVPIAAVRSREELPPLVVAPKGRETSTGAFANLQGLRILVVDDESDTRDLLRTVLESWGAETLTAASAQEGLAALISRHPQVLICDIGMPDEDGYTLIRKVRALKAEQGGDVPAIALTGYVRVEERMRALEAGFQMFVPKPVEADELRSIIAGLVEPTEKG